jgi:hypothetical protein
MVDLNGHEAGNGGYSQRTPTAHRLLYSENPALKRLASAVQFPGHHILKRFAPVLCLALARFFNSPTPVGFG